MLDKIKSSSFAFDIGLVSIVYAIIGMWVCRIPAASASLLCGCIGLFSLYDRFDCNYHENQFWMLFLNSLGLAGSFIDFFCLSYVIAF